MAKKSKDKEKKKEQTSSSPDWRNILKWAYIIGGLIAGLTGAFNFQNEILTWVLVLIGVLIGLFYIDTEDLTNFGVRYLLFGLVFSALSTLPAVGIFLTDFFRGFFTFLGPVALATLVMWFWKKHLAPIMSS